MPASWSFSSQGIDNKMGDPALHVCLEEKRHPRGVWKVRVWPDDDSTSYCFRSKKKKQIIIIKEGGMHCNPPPIHQEFQ